MDIDKLIMEGYSTSQINQICKLDGKFNINKISKDDDVDMLRKLNELISSQKRPKSINNLIYEGLKKGIDEIADWYDKGVNTKSKIKILLEMAENKYNYSKLLEKEYSLEEFKIISNYKKLGYDIETLIDNGYTNDQIDTIIEGKKLGIDVVKLFEDKHTVPQIYKILDAKEKGINLLDYVDKRYNANQMEAIMKGIEKIKNEEDIKIILNPKYKASIMNIIVDGLESGYDITPYINDEDKTTIIEIKLTLLMCKEDPHLLDNIDEVQRAKAIEEGLLRNYDIDIFLDPDFSVKKCALIKDYMKTSPSKDNVQKIQNKDLTEYQIKTAILLMKKDINPEPILKIGYNDLQVQYLTDNLLQGYNIEKIADPSYPLYIMKAIQDCEKFGLEVTSKKTIEKNMEEKNSER